MKVYLSRSNAADPAVFSLVRQVIENLGHEVVTFNGGEYSSKPLLECDALVLVPSAQMLPAIERGDTTTELTDDAPDIGKGQHGQCMEFVKKYAEDYDECGEDFEDIVMPNDKYLLIVNEAGIEDPANPSVYVHNITHVQSQSNSGNWATKYGFLQTDEAYVNIGSVLGREMQTKIPTCKEPLYPVSNSPMLGAARMLGIS